MLLDKIPELSDIESAADRIRQYIHNTPILTCQNLNETTGVKLFFKCENFQKAGAFKSRGACNAVFSLDEDEICDGVATHSSGNHAQALARAAMLRNVKSYIVMPKNAPHVKVAAVKGYLGEITFCEPNLQSREETLKSVIFETGAFEIHPYNNYSIISGQATATLEIFKHGEEPDVIIAPVGGGGLLSGTALASSYLFKKTKVIGAEPLNADDAYRSLQEGKILPSLHPKTIADGLLTSLGSKTFPLIREYVHSIITVQEESIIKAMRLIWERMKIIVEPSAAVALAAILEQKKNFAGQKVVIILSGGNIDLDKIPWIQQTHTL
jgi:threonine dehydratase